MLVRAYKAGSYRNDTEVARLQGWSLPYTHEQAQAFLTEMSTAQPGLSTLFFPTRP